MIKKVINKLRIRKEKAIKRRKFRRVILSYKASKINYDKLMKSLFKNEKFLKEFYS